MNIETGEIRELAEGETPKPTEVPINEGDVVEFKGARFKVVYINIGKQRISIEPCRGEPGEQPVEAKS